MQKAPRVEAELADQASGVVSASLPPELLLPIEPHNHKHGGGGDTTLLRGRTQKKYQSRATANWSHLMLGFLGHRGFFVAAKGGKKVVRVQPLVHLMLGFCQLFQPCPPLLQPSSPFCPGTRKSFGRFAPVAIMSCAFLDVLSRVLAAGEDSF